MTRVIALMLAVVAATSSPAQPVLSVQGGTTFDLGRVYRGSVIERLLTLKNTGSDTLHLARVDVSCGCTGTMVSSKAIPPGGSGTLKITFNSKNFAGPVHKTVTVRSNAAGHEETVISFTADVVDEILLTPQNLLFRNAEVDRVNVTTITVTNNGSTPLGLTAFRTQLKGLILKLPSSPIQPGATAEIRAEFTPEAAAPLISDGVFVKTTNDRQPELFVQVFGNARNATVK
ncbi:MAG: DUF1573 domain-containing protein [Bacteroidota bacterium]